MGDQDGSHQQRASTAASQDPKPGPPREANLRRPLDNSHSKAIHQACHTCPSQIQAAQRYRIHQCESSGSSDHRN